MIQLTIRTPDGPRVVAVSEQTYANLMRKSVAPQLRSKRERSGELSEIGAQIMQLMDKGPVTAKQIADDVGISVSSAAMHLSNLQRRGLAHMVQTYEPAGQRARILTYHKADEVRDG